MPSFRTPAIAKALVASLLILFASSAFAHVTKVVGDGAYTIVVGYLDSPLYAGQIEHADISITDAAGAPVDGLAESLRVEIVGPGGATVVVSIRAVRNGPGKYVAGFIPTVVGNYDVRLSGFIGEHEFDELFEGVEMVHADPVVNDPATISVP
jgi:hypothetical protein